MICPRTTGDSCFYWNKNIYVLGGSVKGICEKYDMINKKWEMIDSFYSLIQSSKIENVLTNFSCVLNFYVLPQ